MDLLEGVGDVVGLILSISSHSPPSFSTKLHLLNLFLFNIHLIILNSFSSEFKFIFLPIQLGYIWSGVPSGPWPCKKAPVRNAFPPPPPTNALMLLHLLLILLTDE